MSLFLKDFGRGDHGNEQYQKFFFGCCSLLAYRDQYTVEEYFRPLEVDTLLGDSRKARKELDWKPKFSIKTLVKEMVQFDLKKLIKN